MKVTKVQESRNKREGKFLKGRRDMRTYYAKYSTRARTKHYGRFKDYLERASEQPECNCGVNHE